MNVPAGLTSSDPDLATRRGFDAGFLGVHVPLPALSARLAADAATYDRDGAPDRELRYEHFSLVLSRTRRFAIVTAVGVDGRRRLLIERMHDKWAFDPRLPQELQVGEGLYLNNALDRGHLVRRQDPDWGDTMAEALLANQDTFHFTNCAPQHSAFNQGTLLWHGLEDYILNNAADHQLRVVVFTAPILAADDKVYRDVQIPRRFWKVVVTRTSDERLHATAYILSQEALLDAPAAAAAAADDWVYGAYRTFQTSVGTIEALADLDFGTLRDADRFVPAAGRFGARAEERELTELTDIVL